MSMEDYIHMYDIVGQHEGASSIQWKHTDTNGGRNAYTLPRKFQQAPNEYQEPMHRPRPDQHRNEAPFSERVDIGSTEQKTSTIKQYDESKLKAEIKNIKRCLCVVSFFLAFLLLVSAAAVGFTAFSFYRTAVRPASDTTAQLSQTGSIEGDINFNELMFNITTNGNDLKMMLFSINQSLESYTYDTEQNISALREIITILSTNWNFIDTQVNRLSNSVSNLQTTTSTTNRNVNNLQSLLSMMNRTVAALQANQSKQPVIRINSIIVTVSSTLRITFQTLNGESFREEGNISTLNTYTSSNSISNDNIIAYRPAYSDVHRSNLGTVFVNLGRIYPCIGNYRHISCKLFPNEDDGFRGGRAILEAIDYNSGIFSGPGTESYGFAFAGCNQITSNCIRSTHPMNFFLVCILPSSRCSEQNCT